MMSVEEYQLGNSCLTRIPAQGVTKKSALILCPGGGYEYCSIREGQPVARAFARSGVDAFVLEYDCSSPPLGRRPLWQLAESVRFVRKNADRFSIDPERIAVGGFSAGAHLAAMLGVTWHRAEWFDAGCDLSEHRPNALVLGYPVISAGNCAHRGSFDRLAPVEEQSAYSVEWLVDPKTPPTFLWHTLDDESVPVENSLLMENALRQAGVSHEMHLFSHGVHGLALADHETADPTNGRLPDRHVARWQSLCAEWLKNL